ncbi:MAG: hypothetical protein GWM90_11060 [Gemmatimonadetes bacterium]|nr:hypothetical protein [Gemmatimonadota bacterium]NIQ54500.1 hypothetical protein [Gemmatimonadota bacterium]NIU74706.1 hypothetical protein [Gammaproteobacteria bacterium]NIX44631.1 hypothetical protein [Gemmatimonadota bacterium]NIY08856.1 hypothetical protein [Gemmatimonadota bacterium]
MPAALLLLAAITAAVVVLRTASYRPLNRALAVVLVLESLTIGLSAGWALMAESPRLAWALGVAGTAGQAALPAAYLAFLGQALPIRMVAPFRDRRVVAVLFVLALIAAGTVVARPGWFMTDLYEPGWARWNFLYARGGILVIRVVALTAVFGLVAALATAAQTEPGSTARTSALFYAAAFGLRDLYMGVMMLSYPVLRPIELWGDLLYNPGMGVVYLAYIGLLAYGVLHAQVLEIELQLKFALTQSAAGAMLAAVFFVLSEGLEAVLPARGALASLLAAAAVVLALLPLHRLARSVVNRLMSGVERSDDYLDARRAEIYRAAAALESALEDGVISPEERAILTRLQAQLELDPALTAALEREHGGLGPAALEG